jgi:DNA-directed RNA polymerase specialized sigma subunit
MEKADFQNYRRLAHEVQLLKAKMDALCDPAGQRYSLTPRAPSGQANTLDNLAAIYAAQEEHYRNKMAEKETQLLLVERAIETLADPAERLVMRYRYINGYDWQKVCVLMLSQGVSERQVYRLHGWALERLRDI